MNAVIGLLSRHQRLYVQRESPIVIHESSEPTSSFNSDTDQDLVTYDAFERSLKTMIKSENMKDRRFIDLHRVK